MRQTERVSQAIGADKNCDSALYIKTKKIENVLGEKLKKKKKEKEKKIILIKATQVLICRKFEIF